MNPPTDPVAIVGSSPSADPANGYHLASPNSTATSHIGEPAFVDDFSTSGAGFDGDKVSLSLF